MTNRMHRIRRMLKGRLGERGDVVLEFAIVIPFLFALMLGGYDMVDYVISVNKIERVAATAADLVARNDVLIDSNNANIPNAIGIFFAAANQVALPIDLNASGRVIISAIHNPDGNGEVVAWQRSGAGYTSSSASAIGSEGGPATLPGSLTVAMGDTLIVSEVYYTFDTFRFSRLLLEGIGQDGATVYRTAFFAPRFDGLDSLTPES